MLLLACGMVGHCENSLIVSRSPGLCVSSSTFTTYRGTMTPARVTLLRLPTMHGIFENIYVHTLNDTCRLHSTAPTALPRV